MEVSILHYSNSIIDLNKLFGMQVMEVGEIRELTKRNIKVSLYAKGINGEHPQIYELPYYEYDKELYDLPYYTRFVDKSKTSNILQGNSTPLLATFQPERTIIRMDGYVDFPMIQNTNIREAYSRAHYIFVSKFLKNHYRKMCPFLKERNCHILYNAVDINDYPKHNSSPKKKILFCSRWVSYKGIFVLMKALSILEKKRDDYEVIIGGGIHVTQKGKQVSDYEERIFKQFGNMRNVRVIGYVPHSKLMKMLHEIDILLFPSLWDEPFGLMPAEAAVAHVPTVAFAVGALPEVISHENTGILIKKNRYDFVNARRLVKALERLLDDQSLVNRLGQNARKRVEELFNWSIYVERLLNIYSAVLGK